ncbi:putative triglyceride lipase isoform X2 [Wolffia australiana]
MVLNLKPSSTETKEPTWNENYTLNVNLSSSKLLQVAAWDANLVAPHKRLGNGGIDMLPLCNGKVHELEVGLEGMGGGGKIYLEVYYKSFSEIDEQKPWWTIPFVTDFLMKNNLGSALKMALGSESINASQFVQSAFGQLKSLNSAYFQKNGLSDGSSSVEEVSDKGEGIERMSVIRKPIHLEQDASSPDSVKMLQDDNSDNGNNDFSESDNIFWRNIVESIDQTVLQKLGFTLPSFEEWGAFELLNKKGLESQKIAEQEYIRTGLASSDRKDEESTNNASISSPELHKTSEDIRKTTWNILGQTESILGALMLSNSAFSQQRKNPSSMEDAEKNGGSPEQEENNVCDSLSDEQQSMLDTSAFDKKEEEIKALFSTAESAMEAWAMLANSLGRSSFIKSEFEKICFLDNISTDTQVAIWRDQTRKRLVIAFRGTEQTKWKDLTTDLMLVPSGLNPERMGGNFKEEVQVHSGFLGAYDSVRNRIMTLIKLSVGYHEDMDLETISKWRVYVTGHSLGGALATLLAFELSSSQMAKRGVISITMYNFGSPRVGNRCFTEIYNQRVRDSWRIVNHRDIIPTVPRLMGYCHVAQPVYLAAGDLENALVNLESLEDEYMGDVIGESTPDTLVSNLIQGERELIEKILQTEINLFRSIRDGTALMQHMEDFYYVTLLERVRSNYAASKNPKWKDLEA